MFLNRTSEHFNESAFCLLLKQDKGILLKPQDILDIPLTFTPTAMKSYEATVTVSIQRYDPGQDGSFSTTLPSSLTNNLSWILPVIGIPVSHALSDSRAITIECQSRDRTEQIIELTLSGVVSSTLGSLYTANIRTPVSLIERNSLKEAELDVDNVPFSESFRLVMEIRGLRSLNET